MANIDRIALLTDIATNPQKHQVNRAEKMERTINVMVEQLNKQQDAIDNHVSTGLIKEDNRGYGNKNGRIKGD